MSIEVKDLTYIYEPGTSYEKVALSHINLEIQPGEFVGIIGHTGSGKSTLIQHLNGLLRPTEGSVYYNGEDIFSEKGKSKKLCQKIGLVFQYPEYQLFETTVWRDVAFGPKNMGLSKDEIERRVEQALSDVGLGPDVYESSPFGLSGGQRRRVAIAGILAMEPEYLILDEPTAGLDPQGREEILGKVAQLREKENMAVLLVSHSMDDVARYVDRIIALDNGSIRFDGAPADVFAHEDELKQMGLDIPQITKLANALRNRGYAVDEAMLETKSMVNWIVRNHLLPKEEIG
jgi:energy-coupling factor transport system ATP-binding protein